jgi:hypothetical protein
MVVQKRLSPQTSLLSARGGKAKPRRHPAKRCRAASQQRSWPFWFLIAAVSISLLFLAQVAIALLIFGEVALAAEGSFIAPPSELCAGFELALEPLDGVVGPDYPEMGSFEGYEGVSGPSDMGGPIADLPPPGPGYSRTSRLLASFWSWWARRSFLSWWARRAFRSAAEPAAGAQRPFCSGLGSQAAKSAHFRKMSELHALHKELCVKTLRYKHLNAAQHNDFLFMTSPEGLRLFKEILARNEELDYRRRVDDEAYLRRLFLLFPDCRPLNRPEFKMRSTPPGVDEPFERSVYFAMGYHEQLVRFGLIRWGLEVD